MPDILFSSTTDMATIVGLSSADHPEEFKNKELFLGELQGNRTVLSGDWKIVSKISENV